VQAVNLSGPVWDILDTQHTFSQIKAERRRKSEEMLRSIFTAIRQHLHQCDSVHMETAYITKQKTDQTADDYM